MYNVTAHDASGSATWADSIAASPRVSCWAAHRETWPGQVLVDAS